jgi:hypothetical protein
VHDDPGGLVDDEQVLVFPGDPERQLLGCERGRGAFGDLERELLPALEPVALRSRLAVDERCSGLEQALGGRARADLRPRGEEPVEPLARGLCWNRDSERAQPRARRGAACAAVIGTREFRSCARLK